MRIIKLSPKDRSFPDHRSVHMYFEQTLLNRTPEGQFFLTKGRISNAGIDPGELLMFSYCTEILYLAKAKTGRLTSDGFEKSLYPHYFCVDCPTIKRGRWTLVELERALREIGALEKNLVRAQGWPRLAESPAVEMVWNQFKE